MLEVSDCLARAFMGFGIPSTCFLDQYEYGVRDCWYVFPPVVARFKGSILKIYAQNADSKCSDPSCFRLSYLEGCVLPVLIRITLISTSRNSNSQAAEEPDGALTRNLNNKIGFGIPIYIPLYM